jgi:DNA-binding GntR family transcriptional regulator
MSQGNVALQQELLHEQVYRVLRARIVNGEWKPQSLLPGEVMLSQEMGVSVGTVRKAMDQLARENLVLRERGRGTFVRRDDDWQFVGRGVRLVDGEGRAVAPSIVLDSALILDATESETEALKIRGFLFGKPRVLRIEWIWTLGQTLLGTETSSVDVDRFAEIAGLLTTGAGAVAKAMDDEISARSDRVTWQLGNLGDAAMPLCRMTFNARGLLVELRQFRLRLDIYQLQIIQMPGVPARSLSSRQ